MKKTKTYIFHRGGFEGLDSIDYFKPLMRSVSDLIRPIVVEGYNNGEPFVPLRHLSGYEGVFEFVSCFKVPHGEWIANYKHGGETVQFGLPSTLHHCHLDIAERLMSWHFWLWGDDVFNKGFASLIS